MTDTDAAPRRGHKPDWRKTAATRLGTHERLLGTTAIPKPCPHCGHTTLTGWDAPLLAGLATCDPYALTPTLEAAAVILARPTWRLWGTPGQYELTPRHEPGLPTIGQLKPADQITALAQHTCGTPPLSTDTIPLKPAQAAVIDGPPPF